MYLCPLCHQPLTENPAGYHCAARHQFDRAKEGYLHLLPVQQKKSLDPGDNAAMIQARRAFLTAGFYQPLSDAVNQILRSVLTSPQPVVLDIGCGEGYYSARLHTDLTQQGRPPALYGIDISKAAVKAAAKKYPLLRFAVASSYQLPFATASVDALLRIYAPSLASELARVATAGGWLCTVTPAPHHLVEIKQRIYPTVRLHSQDINTEQGFSHRKRQQLSWMFQPATPEELDLLLQMIPLGYRVTDEVRSRLLADLPGITLDFYLDLYQRDHPEVQ